MSAVRRLLLAALVIALSACASAPDRAAEQGGLTEDTPAPEFSLPLPEHTRLLVRLQPEGIDGLIEAARPYVRAMGSELPEMGEPGPLAVWAAVVGARRVRYAGPEEASELAQGLEGFDKSRPIFIALSTRGNEEHLRHLKGAVPPVGTRSLFAGFSSRLFIPATDPDGLRARLAKLFEPSPTASPGVRRVATHAEYVVVDIHYDPLAVVRERLGVEPVELQWAASDRSYVERMTPALASFLRSEASVALYMRNEDLPEIGALMGSMEALQALESAAIDKRADLLTIGYALAGDVLRMASPEAREFEDMAVAMDADAAGGLHLEAHRTFTTLGATLAHAGEARPDLGVTASDEPVLDLSWSRAKSSAPDQAPTPYWLARLVGDDAAGRKVMNLLRMGGVWPWVVALTNYPTAFEDGMERALGPQTNFRAQRWQMWGCLVGMHANIGWTPEPTAPLAGVPDGSFSVVTQPGCRWERTLRGLANWLRGALGAKVTIRVEEFDGMRRVDVLFGQASGRREVPQASAGTLDATLDLARLASHLERAPPTNAVPPAVVEGLRAVGTLNMRHRLLSNGTVLQLELGQGVAPEMSSPVVHDELRQPATDPDCLREVRFVSRTVSEEIGRDDARQRRTLWTTLLGYIEEAMSTCAPGDDAVADELAWMHTRWSVYGGRQLARKAFWEPALDLFGDACKRGDQDGCAHADRAREIRAKVRPARVSRVDASLDDLQGELAFVTRQTIVWSHFNMLLAGKSYDPLALEEVDDKADILRRRFPIEPLEVGPGTVAAGIIPVDRGVSSTLVRRLVELMAQRNLESVRYASRFSELRHAMPAAAWTGFVVESAAAKPDALEVLVFGGRQHLEHMDRPHLDLDVSYDGIEVAIEGESVDAISGCPSDGPTVCVADAEQVRAQLEDALGPADSDATHDWPDDGALGALYRLEALRGRLDEAYDGPAPVVVIRAEVNLPFDALAQLHATVGRWADARGWEAPRVILLD